MIAIIDFGMGNQKNVLRAFGELGCDAFITSEPDLFTRAERLVLPGVGAFGEAIRRIEEMRIRKHLVQFIESGRPVLGICLGMQLLFEDSEESIGYTGFGVFPGTVSRFRGDMKVPHVGWNDVVGRAGQPLLEVGNPQAFYFVHSYYAPVGQHTIGTSEYGILFSAAVRKEHVFGVQFHPEKSQAAGLEVLRKFSEV